jgi:hypothetical protein
MPWAPHDRPPLGSLLVDGGKPRRCELPALGAFYRMPSEWILKSCDCGSSVPQMGVDASNL